MTFKKANIQREYTSAHVGRIFFNYFIAKILEHTGLNQVVIHSFLSEVTKPSLFKLANSATIADTAWDHLSCSQSFSFSLPIVYAFYSHVLVQSLCWAQRNILGKKRKFFLAQLGQNTLLIISLIALCSPEWHIKKSKSGTCLVMQGICSNPSGGWVPTHHTWFAKF